MAVLNVKSDSASFARLEHSEYCLTNEKVLDQVTNPNYDPIKKELP